MTTHRSGGDGPVYQCGWTVAVTGLAGGHLRARAAGQARRSLPQGGMGETQAMYGAEGHGGAGSAHAMAAAETKREMIQGATVTPLAPSGKSLPAVNVSACSRRRVERRGFTPEAASGGAMIRI